MSLWVIELNDVGIRLYRDGDLLETSPGVAMLAGKQILTGAEAAAKQQLEPRAVYNRFWQQLNETPLQGGTRQCRHHADLAYHHLSAMLARHGQPAEAVIAVPGHYDETQLSLLLGICGALKLKVGGLVDSNVAALSATAGPGRYAVIEIYQHDVTVCEVTVDAQTGVARRHLKVIESAGFNRIQQASIDLIADAFLEQSRFDPLHEAATEQLLFSNLENWMTQSLSRSELEIAIDYHGSHFGARVHSVDLERIGTMVLDAVAAELDRSMTTVLSASLAQLPGALTSLAPAEILPKPACASGIAEHRLAISSDGTAVPYVTQLPACAEATLNQVSKPPVTVLETRDASHLLVADHAVAIDGSGVQLSADGTLNRAPGGVRVTLEQGHLMLQANGLSALVNGQPAGDRQRLLPGDRITLDEHTATFIAISVSHASAT